jgi:peptidoglycan/LPS O-acetylase OafA/YrhL
MNTPLNPAPAATTTGSAAPGLAMGAFLAVLARQPEGVERLVRALPRVVAVAAGLLAVTLVGTRLVSREGLQLVLPVRTSLILRLLAFCLLVWDVVAPKHSATSRFFRSRAIVFLGTYSYGLYVYHHFISYNLSANRTELELARWVGSHAAAVALQATLGASVSLAVAYLSYEFFEKRFLLNPLFKTAEDPGPPSSRQRASSFLERRTVEQGVALVTTSAVFNDSSGRLNDSSAHRN